MSEVVLIHPPVCDPTAPYLALPILTACLRRAGVSTLPVDANVEAFDGLFRQESMRAAAKRLQRRLGKLEGKGKLKHTEQLAYLALSSAWAEAHEVPSVIEDAMSVLRDRGGERFYDPETYAGAVQRVDAAMRLISAAYAPLRMTFTSYKTPFAMLNRAEIEADAGADRNPFHDYFVALARRISDVKPRAVGISVAFPGQVLPAYMLAHILRKELPGVFLVGGGPALTQLFQQLPPGGMDTARGDFDSVITYEAEEALVQLVMDLRAGKKPQPVIQGRQAEDLSGIPAPDFQGLPLDLYFTPELVLPYDPTRGCYFGLCTFCHYGLAEVGTARYRERPVGVVVEHLQQLHAQHGCDLFYFSQDSVNPKTALRLARALRDRGAPFRWSTDMRPERSLTPELCQELREGGALSMALGVESASDRVLGLIDKGVPVSTVRAAMASLAGAEIGVEAMCFTDFPTESYREAMATVDFLAREKEHVSLFICGEFDLSKGSLVAQKPAEFGIAETWRVKGDELGMGLFYREARAPKSPTEREKVEQALGALSRGWWLEHYPWAGSLSTAHTMLYYRRHGPDCFRRFARVPGRAESAQPPHRSRYDMDVMAEALEHEAAIWETMVYEERHVSRARYTALTADLAPVLARHRGKGGTPERHVVRKGRRPPHSINATKDPVRGWG